MKEYDTHVATQGQVNDEFEEQLLALGYTRDKLESRLVTFLNDRPHSSCPLIATHMTKKGYDTALQVKTDLTLVQEQMENYDQVGYVHGEITTLDETIQSNKQFKLTKQWPVKRLESEIRSENKTWDLHISVPTDNLPEKLEEQLSYEKSGLYHIELHKVRDEKTRLFRVYTMQGIGNPKEGKQLWHALNKWFKDTNAPHVEMKHETYIGMIRVGNPQIVPPTVCETVYK